MGTVAGQMKKKWSEWNPDVKFHVWIAVVSAVVVAVSVIGCRSEQIETHFGKAALGLVAVLAMLSPLPAYWHEKRRINLRESTLVIAWEALMAVMLPYVVLVAARIQVPLRDGLFGRIDSSLGVSVPAIQIWAQHNWLGHAFNWTYPLLIPFLVIAALAPGLLGKVKQARWFLIGNLAAFAIGMPMFALLPAVGPWVFNHMVPNIAQAHCQAQLLALRSAGPVSDTAEFAALVCFPSFHVIWAVLCCVALWGWRWLRIPAALLSCMIIFSTLTTGWHYFVDVLAGLAIAAIALAYATWCTRKLETRSRSVVAAKQTAVVEA